MTMADELATLRAAKRLSELVDEVLERTTRSRLPLAACLHEVLQAACSQLGARGAYVHTFDEDLALRTFRFPESLAIPHEAETLVRTGAEGGERVTLAEGAVLVVAGPLDVAGYWFGSAGLVVDAAGADVPLLSELLETLCEELDNHLQASFEARQKQQVLLAVGKALRNAVLIDGFRDAVEELDAALPLERLLMVHASDANPAALPHLQLFEHGKLALDTLNQRDPATTGLREKARAYLRDADPGLLTELGFARASEEILIEGVLNTTVVGKVVAAPSRPVFNTYDRDLLAAFCEFIRQRVVDYNKEWRTLSRTFGPDVVARLMQAEDYRRRYLTPREAEVAILYVDIAGFTRMSEQILKTPAAVASLVETWGTRAVDLVWAHGGAFDKMVGDCVIALFGPPFYEADPSSCLASAVACARAIREMTNRLPEQAGFEALAKGGVAVTAGVNLAPLFLGEFEPNEEFTGFSSGMNNTARLQGCGERNEILVMAESIPRLPQGHAFGFGPERAAKVKNVAEPLRFRPLLD